MAQSVAYRSVILGIAFLLAFVTEFKGISGRPEIKIYEKYKDRVYEDDQSEFKSLPEMDRAADEEFIKGKLMTMELAKEDYRGEEEFLANLKESREFEHDDENYDDQQHPMNPPLVEIKTWDSPLSPPTTAESSAGYIRKHDLPAKCEPRLG